MTVPRDENRVPMFDPNYGSMVSTSMTFDGATTNDPGDFNGTGNPATLFTVTGAVRLKLLAVCTTTLTIDAGATLEIGTAASTAGLIAQTAADAIDQNEIWHDATPDASIELTSVLADNIVTDDVIQTVATANINTGAITYYAMWYPLSPDGNVTAA